MDGPPPSLPTDDIEGPLEALAGFGLAPEPRGRTRVHEAFDINPLCRPVLPSRLESAQSAPNRRPGRVERVDRVEVVEREERPRREMGYGDVGVDNVWGLYDQGDWESVSSEQDVPQVVVAPQRHVRTPTRVVRRAQSHEPSRSQWSAREVETAFPYGDECRVEESSPRCPTPQRMQRTAVPYTTEHHLKVAARNYTPGEVIPPHVAKNLKEKKARRADPVSAYARYRSIWNKNRTSTSKK